MWIREIGSGSDKVHKRKNTPYLLYALTEVSLLIYRTNCNDFVSFYQFNIQLLEK